MIDSKGDRLAQGGGRVKLRKPPQGRPALTQTHTLFLEIDWKSTAYWDSEALTLCSGSHCLPASITPSALLLSHSLTLSVIHTQPNVAVWYKHKGSLFRNYNPTQIQHCGKKAKEREGNQKRVSFSVWLLTLAARSDRGISIGLMGNRRRLNGRAFRNPQNSSIFIHFFSTFIWIVGAFYNQVHVTVWNFRIFGTAEEKLYF